MQHLICAGLTFEGVNVLKAVAVLDKIKLQGKTIPQLATDIDEDIIEESSDEEATQTANEEITDELLEKLWRDADQPNNEDNLRELLPSNEKIWIISEKYPQM